VSVKREITEAAAGLHGRAMKHTDKRSLQRQQVRELHELFEDAGCSRAFFWVRSEGKIYRSGPVPWNDKSVSEEQELTPTDLLDGISWLKDLRRPFPLSVLERVIGHGR
jgi:hypothetical protein